MSNKMKKIGILGGTFDPIHIGHLHLAKSAFEQLELDMVLFIPAFVSPFKEGKTTSFAHRLAMTSLAIAKESCFFVSSIEGLRDGKSYTADTLEALSEIYTNSEFYFLSGVDAVNTLSVWHDWEKILELCYFVVLPRPNYELDYHQSFWQEEKYRRKIILLDAQEIDISSTMLRNGQAREEYLPASVQEYILKNQLYEG